MGLLSGNVYEGETQFNFTDSLIDVIKPWPLISITGKEKYYKSL